MEINENLTKLIFREFDDSIKGTDIYNHEGSMWLIFTEERKWVIEFTKQKTLWYNYKHFTDILVLFGMELNEGAEYIKKWYEERFLFKPKIVDDSIKERLFFVEDTIDNGVKHTYKKKITRLNEVEDTVQNGVKETTGNINDREGSVENTIQNGVKNSQSFDGKSLKLVEDAIQNGVKNIYGNKHYTALGVEKTIQNGVKHTEWNGSDLPTHKVENTIQNGVKTTKGFDMDDEEVVEYLIQNGVKNTSGSRRFRESLVKDTIQNGVKEVEYYDGDAEVLVNEAIENGVKEVMDGNGQVFLVSEVIRKGVKRTSSRGPFSDGTVEDAVKYGVKIVDYHILESMEQKDHSVTTLDFTEKIKDTIENGVKEISSVDCEYPRATENVIKNGVKLKN